MRDNQLVSIAAQMLTTRDELANIQGVKDSVLIKHSAAILDAVKVQLSFGPLRMCDCAPSEASTLPRAQRLCSSG